MGYILLYILAVLFSCFVLVPLSFFRVFGLSENINLLHAGYRIQAAIWLAVFYLLNIYLVYRAIRSNKKKPLWKAAVYAMWGLGFLGLINLFITVVSRYK